MRSSFTKIILASGLAVLLLAITPAISQQTPASGQFPAYRPPRMADGHPDLNGIWQAFVSANWDLQDHEAQPGPHPEIMGAYGGGPAGQNGGGGGGNSFKTQTLGQKRQKI